MSKKYTHLLTKDFFEEYYVNNNMSYPDISKMLRNQGYNIWPGTLYNYAKDCGIGRNYSEARILWDNSSLDYKKSFLDERTVESIDGFLLGDGCLYKDKRCKKSQTARLTCSLEYKEFCIFLMKPFKYYNPSIYKQNSKTMKQGFKWMGQSLFHPDLYIHWQRWYENSNEKQPPDDVRITPQSVMMWYLGDGSLVQHKGSVTLRLSTDGFLPERVEFLASKLKEKNIKCHRNNDNRIYVEAKGIPNFFNFIGNDSPIKCYNYKFNLPLWRFKAKRMKEVSEELGIEYQKLAHWVKSNYVRCYRESASSRPRFLPEHIEEIKKYAEKN